MSVASIPIGLPFVDALAAGLLAEVEGERAALAEVRVLLPTRRACRSLGEAFLRRAGGRPLLLPRIQPIGEVEADELLLDGTLELALPPPIGGLRRQLLLARLLAPLGWPIEHALRLATELAALLDELQTERVSPAALDRLVPDDLAGHWQKSREVLAIIANAWPQVLAELGALDPAERRHRLLTALAERWRAEPPAARIVAAGSTGSIPATRALLQVVARLPRGTVVLPGLDRDLDEAAWRLLEASHPQYGLKQLLEALAVDRGAVATWTAQGVVGAPPARVSCPRRCGRAPRSGPGRRWARHRRMQPEASRSKTTRTCRARRWHWRCGCAPRSRPRAAAPPWSPPIAISPAGSRSSCAAGGSRSTIPPGRRSTRPRPAASSCSRRA
ncbi:MAG TPA: hypothetical protein VFY19_03805 [Geminicoccaceae bacterium]|nr:hypothetical protein [Geminicoccaceae bacterium]